MPQLTDGEQPEMMSVSRWKIILSLKIEQKLNTQSMAAPVAREPVQPQRIRATSDKSPTMRLQEKAASEAYPTFLSEAADASH